MLFVAVAQLLVVSRLGGAFFEFDCFGLKQVQEVACRALFTLVSVFVVHQIRSSELSEQFRVILVRQPSYQVFRIIKERPAFGFSIHIASIRGFDSRIPGMRMRRLSLGLCAGVRRTFRRSCIQAHASHLLE